MYFINKILVFSIEESELTEIKTQRTLQDMWR